MESSLFKERADFLKKARSMPTVEKRKPAPWDSDQGGSSSQPTGAGPSAEKRSKTGGGKEPPMTFDYKTASLRPQDQARFSVLSKVVKYMRERHVDGDRHPLSAEEILDEINVLHTLPKQTQIWLEREALPNNPKIKLTPENKFIFKPKYDIRTKRDLLHLLRRHDMKGLGGVLKEDVTECLSNVDKVLKDLGDQVTQITRSNDKKMVLFYNDKSFDLQVDEEFKKLWRSCTVDNMHESKIEEYLQKNGIVTMSGEKKSFLPASKLKRNRRRRGPVKLRDNEHLEGIIEDFSEKFHKD